MAIARVAYDATTPAASNDGGTSDAIDTSGASLLILMVNWYSGGGAGAVVAGTNITDNKSNTWVPLTKGSSGGADEHEQIWYVANPIVGTGHTVTVERIETYLGFIFVAYSGVSTSSPFDQENVGTSASTSLTLPSTTPSENNELVITGVNKADNTVSSPFDGSLLSQNGTPGVSYDIRYAEDIQTTATARAPAWSGAGSVTRVGTIATFKATAAAATTRRNLLLLGAGA